MQKLYVWCRSVASQVFVEKLSQTNDPPQTQMNYHLRTPQPDIGFMKSKYARSLKVANLDPKFSCLSQHTNEHSIRNALHRLLSVVRRHQYSKSWSVFTTIGRSTTFIYILFGPWTYICFFPMFLYNVPVSTVQGLYLFKTCLQL